MRKSDCIRTCLIHIISAYVQRTPAENSPVDNRRRPRLKSALLLLLHFVLSPALKSGGRSVLATCSFLINALQTSLFTWCHMRGRVTLSAGCCWWDIPARVSGPGISPNDCPGSLVGAMLTTPTGRHCHWTALRIRLPNRATWGFGPPTGMLSPPREIRARRHKSPPRKSTQWHKASLPIAGSGW